MDLVSVIVPVYNTEKYLRKCLDSLIGQTYRDLEIILVDDGSTDSCATICDEYALDDPRIKCFHIENGGVSNARNIGIKNANGRYIQFIDSDDYYEPDSIEVMVSAIGDDMQLAVARYSVVRGSHIERVVGTDKEEILDCEGYLRYAFPKNIGFYFGTTANKIYVADIIRNNGVLFESEVTLCEDLLFNLQYNKHVNKVHILGRNVYFYEQGNCESLVKKKRPRGETFRCKSLIYKAYIDTFTVRESYDTYKVDISNYLMENVVQEFKEIIEYEGNRPKKELLEIVRDFCKIDYVNDSAMCCRDRNRLVNLTAKYMCRDKFSSIIAMYKVKRFVKEKMRHVHEFIKRSNGD